MQKVILENLLEFNTPIFIFLGISVTLTPYFFVDNYMFIDWLYRALIFLVVSYPYVLVISILLGYFGELEQLQKTVSYLKGFLS